MFVTFFQLFSYTRSGYALRIGQQFPSMYSLFLFDHLEYQALVIFHFQETGRPVYSSLH